MAEAKPITEIEHPKTVSLFAWQGWRLSLPIKWNPVRLEGNYANGSALFADMHRVRLGVRWKKVGGRKFNPDKWSRSILREEVGQLAAAEARAIELHHAEYAASLLYIEPKPPGRDVFVAFSPISGRMIELIYHTRRREHPLATTICPTLQDMDPEKPMAWSAFDLSCVIPEGMRLESQTLNAGDLSLTFADSTRRVTVRQIAVAELALKRMPIDKWMIEQERRLARHFRPRGKLQRIELRIDGRTLTGVARAMRRRWRFFWKVQLPKAWQTVALHDIKRDRLVLLQSTGGELMDQVLKTIGWASGYVPVEVRRPKD